MSKTTKINLNGYYTYTAWRNLSDDGHTQFDFKINSDGTVSGAGRDNPGAFVISGVLIGDDLRFIKQYTGQTLNWKYIGKRIPPLGNVYQFAGGWGAVSSTKQDGQFVFAGVDSGPPEPAAPHEPIEGQWEGQYFYADNIAQNDAPMNFTIGLDPSASYTANGPFNIVGSGKDGVGSFKIKGTVTKVNPDGSGGDMDVVKAYDATASSSGWEWRYQGRYDGQGSIGGIWRNTKDDNAPTRGSFQLTQKSKLPIANATAILPAQAAVFGSPTSNQRPSVETALRTAAGQGAVQSNLLLNLVNGFSS